MRKKKPSKRLCVMLACYFMTGILLFTSCSAETAVTDFAEAVAPEEIDAAVGDDFLVGYWASIGSYSFGMAQPGITVWFDGEHGCFYSPYDTYKIEPQDDYYVLYCTNYLWGDTLDFRMDILDENNVAINFHNDSRSTYLTRTDEDGNYLGIPYSGDMSGNVFTGEYHANGFGVSSESDAQTQDGTKELQTELRMMDFDDLHEHPEAYPEKLSKGQTSSDYNGMLAYLLIALCNDVYKKDAIIQDYRDMGFDTLSAGGYRKLSGITYMLGKKYLSDGTEEILISIKGTDKENLREVANDLNKGLGGFSYPHWHEGFSETSDIVYKDVLDFADNPKNAIYYITGFSLGAASANLLSVRLSDYGVPKENVYDYNFACPDVAVGLGSEWNKDGVHDNMFNLGNCQDKITVLPGASFNVMEANVINQWGKFGKSFWFSDNWDDPNEVKAITWFDAHDQWKYLKYFNVRRSEGAENLKDWAAWKSQVAKVKVGAVASFFTIGAHCPVDVIINDTYGNSIASVIGGKPEYYNSEPGEVWIFTDADEKVFLVPYDNIAVDISGTGEGTMDFEVYRGAMGEESELISSYKNVEIHLSDALSCDIETEEDKTDVILSMLDEAGNVTELLKPDKNVEKGKLKKVLKIVGIIVGVLALTIAMILIIDSIHTSRRRKKRGATFGRKSARKKTNRRRHRR